jgi:hypothetical protein
MYINQILLLDHLNNTGTLGASGAEPYERIYLQTSQKPSQKYIEQHPEVSWRSVGRFGSAYGTKI